MTISKDRVKPSPVPDSWKLSEIFTTGVVLGGYLALMTVIFFWAAFETNFFPVMPSFSSFQPLNYLQKHLKIKLKLLFFFVESETFQLSLYLCLLVETL